MEKLSWHQIIPIVEYEERLKRMEKLLWRSEKSRKTMVIQMRKMKTKLKRLQQEVRTKYIEAMNKLFNEDQVKLLTNIYKKMPRWSNDTLIKAYRLKFTCGSHGYEELHRNNFPLPSLRTLSRHLENLKFLPGNCNEIYEFLKIKIVQFRSNTDTNCVLIVDEMSITCGRFYCTSTNRILGESTIPSATKNIQMSTHCEKPLANHAMVFLLGGIASRWKQVVRYELTSGSIHSQVFKSIIEDIITQAESIGLHIHAVTSDMGGSNQSMWKQFGVNVSRYSTIKTFCEHPCDKSRKLYFFPDAVHIFKNIRCCLVTNRLFKLSDNIVNKYQLPSNKVLIDHIKDLANFQKDIELKPARKLNDENLDLKNQHFGKMRVKNSTSVLSYDVSSGLKYLSEETSQLDYITTSWFVEQVTRWFDLMSNRNPALALSMLKPQKYSETIEFLNEIIDIFNQMEIGTPSAWKPIQTAVLMSTTSLLQLSEYLLNEIGFQFVLSGRFTQDCIENLFSVIRIKNIIPNALQFKNNLKFELILVAHYMKNISNSSYFEDDEEFFSEFLNIVRQN